MPSRTSACCKAVRAFNHSIPSSIWITDDILADAFNRFRRISRATNPKRYGSNVPGPLEAQRRLAKRRMMGLAAAGGPPAFDMGALFGTGPPRSQELRWEAPAVPIGHPVPPKSTYPTAWPPGFEYMFDIPDEPPEDQYEKRLREARTVQEIHHLREELQEHEMGPVEFSKASFAALLDNEAPFEDINAFLNDTQLNIPEAQNMNAFISHTNSAGLTQDQFLTLLTSMRQSLTLGMILPPELLLLIKNIEDYVRRDTSDTQTSKRKLFRAYQAIWKGMVACRITPVSLEAVNLLFPMLRWRRVCDEDQRAAASLQFELNKYAWPIREQDWRDTECSISVDSVAPSSQAPTIEQWLASWLGRVYDFECQNETHISSHVYTLDRMALTGIINRLPPNSAAPLVASTTRLLISQKPDSKQATVAWEARINIWLSCLRRSSRFKKHFDITRYVSAHASEGPPNTYHVTKEWAGVYRALAPYTSLSQLEPHFSAINPNECNAVDTCRILLQFWAPLHHEYSRFWSSTNKHSPRFVPLPKLLAHFEKLNAQRVKISKFPATPSYVNLIATLAWNELPYRQIIEELFDLIKHRDGVQELVNFCWALKRRGIEVYAQPVQQVMHELATEQPLLALALYKCRKTWISNCPDLLLSLIKEGVHSSEIFTVLKDKEPGNSIPMELRSHPLNCISDLRNRLIHMIADTMSRYPRPSLRVTYRDVYFCYRYLVDRHSPLHPLMGRALVRVGATLPLQKGMWVSTRRFVWILGIVRQLEGDQVAKELDTVIYRWRTRVQNIRRAEERKLLKQGMWTGAREMRVFLQKPLPAKYPRRKSGVPVRSPKLAKRIRQRQRKDLKSSTSITRIEQKRIPNRPISDRVPPRLRWIYAFKGNKDPSSITRPIPSTFHSWNPAGHRHRLKALSQSSNARLKITKQEVSGDVKSFRVKFFGSWEHLGHKHAEVANRMLDESVHALPTDRWGGEQDDSATRQARGFLVRKYRHLP